MLIGSDPENMRTKVIFCAAILSLTVSCAWAGERAAVDYINPLIGASTSAEYGEGKTFPGAATPFGLVQLSPDTITGGDNGPGYSYEHKTIEGFSFTHMSGIGWYGDLGNFQVMPAVGPLQTDRDRAKSEFRHDEETARAGYYGVKLRRYGILAEMTAAPRAGILRFTYPEARASRIQIDLHRRIGEKERWKQSSKQHIRVVDDHTIEGWMYCPCEDGGWGRGAGHVTYSLHFYAQFSKSLTSFGIWDKDQVMPGRSEYEGKNLGFYAECPTRRGEQVLMKVGISFVSVAGAKANLEHDIPDWDFERACRQARDLWSAALEGLRVEGGTDAQKEAFFTALYHCQIDPRSTSDVDGRYLGADHRAHQAAAFTYRTIFSGWDVFRSQFPLLTIIAPKVVNDEINSLVQLADLSGRKYFERWEILNAYSGCMIGHPAVSVLADAYLKGIRDYDVAKAYQFAKTSVNMTYNKLGYHPGDISWTLEQAYYDHCAARLAAALGHKDEAVEFSRRAMDYVNIYDPAVGNMHARRADGAWTPWRGRTAGGQGCVESNPYQQGWFVPHDVQGLINLMGREYFLAYLTEFFEKTPLSFQWNDYYNHSNEPVHHVAYLFVYAGQPWLTQKWTRIIMDHAYGPGVKGLCGNEDVGQMSAWYVLSAMGLHPVSPVDGVYILGSPLFDKITVRLEPKYHQGKSFTVIAKGNSAKNVYIQSARLDGKELNRAWLTYREITGGGSLELVMGPEPNRHWASAPENLPPSLSGQVECVKAEIAPLHAKTSLPLRANVTVRNSGDKPAWALVPVMEGRQVLAQRSVLVGAGQSQDVSIALRLETEGKHRLSVVGIPCAEVETVDDVRPAVMSLALPEGRRNVILSFSKPLARTVAESTGNYKLDGAAPPRLAHLSANGTLVTLGFTQEISRGDHRLAVHGLFDLTSSRNVIEPVELAFSTVDAVVRTYRSTTAWADLPTGAPSATDYADRHSGHGVTIRYVEGYAPPHRGAGARGHDLPRLIDGEMSLSDDDTRRSTWLDGGPARLVMDLGAEIDIDRINTFSRHRTDRAPQKFVLYGACGSSLPDAAAKTLGAVWQRIGAVDTTPLGQGGMHVSSIAAREQFLGRFRYLLWVLEPINKADQGTFLTEIDVYCRHVKTPGGPSGREGKKTSNKIVTRSGIFIVKAG
jgi:predicted alpha-1,2-mannosidase